MTGLLSATWAARIPATQDRLHLSTSALAVAVLGIEGGALLGLPVGGALVARYGSSRSVRLGFGCYAALLVPLGLVPTLGWLTAFLFPWAAANSVVDVAMNAAVVHLEAGTARRILSRLHAGQSVGLLVGGLVATGATAGRLPLFLHFGGVALAAGLAVVGFARWLPDDAPRTSGRLLVLPDRHLLLLGAVAFCGFLIDGAASNWVAVDLRGEEHASATLAAAGYTCVTAAVATVRLLGDRALTRYRRSRLVQVSGGIAACGASVVVLARTAGVALTGWILVGAGLALLAPTVLGAVPHTRTTATPAAAIASVTTLGYLGSFTGPPAIGVLAGASSLSCALGLLIIAALVTAALAPRAVPPLP